MKIQAVTLKILAFLEKIGKGSPFVSAHKRFVAESLGLSSAEMDGALRFAEENGILFYDTKTQCFGLPSAFEGALKCFLDGAMRRRLCAEFYKIMRDSLAGEIVVPLRDGGEYRIPQHHIFEWTKLYPDRNVVLEVMRYQNMAKHCPSRRPVTPEQMYEAILSRLERAGMSATAMGMGSGGKVSDPETRASVNESGGMAMALRAFPETSGGDLRASEAERRKQRQQFRKLARPIGS